MQQPPVEEPPPPPAVNLKPGKKFGQWRVVDKLDEGGFGFVYRVQHVAHPERFAALKAESNAVEGGSAIKLEMAILSKVHADGEKLYLPVLYHSAKRKHFCYMIITLLGRDLRTLKMGQLGDRFSVRTWIRVAIQGMYALKQLHDCGFVHRDVKPSNFAMGVDAMRQRLVHLLDFGLSRSYASQENGVWVARRARATAEFRGTVRYASPTVHERMEQGRRDDLWSFMFVVLEMHQPLPWKNDRDPGVRKLNLPDRLLMVNIPEELHGIIPSLRSLNVYSRPPYERYHEKMRELMQRMSVSFNDPYDWETEQQARQAVAQQPRQPPHENAAAFFAADTVGVHGPPPPGARSNGGTAEEGDRQLRKLPPSRSPYVESSKATSEANPNAQ